MTLIQPLKWWGGKHYLAPKIIALMPPHLHYVEPYAGGLAVLLEKDPFDLTPATKQNLTLEELEKTWMAKHHLPSMFISATEKTNLEALRELIWRETFEIRKKRYPEPVEP